MEQLTQEQVDVLLRESTGERVTKEYIERRIADTLFTTLVEGSTVTICQITIDNGFTVRGETDCVDPTNYNEDLGKHYAYKNAFEKLWELFGFLLAEKMYREKLTGESIVQVGYEPHSHEGEEPAFEAIINLDEIDADEATRAKGFYQGQSDDEIAEQGEVVVDLTDLSEDEITAQLLADHDVEMATLADDLHPHEINGDDPAWSIELDESEITAHQLNQQDEASGD